jgi:hypothetical protein
MLKNYKEIAITRRWIVLAHNKQNVTKEQWKNIKWNGGKLHDIKHMVYMENKLHVLMTKKMISNTI